MKFTRKQVRWHTPTFHGRKAPFKFTIGYADIKEASGYYILAIHYTKDIRYNSVWDDTVFKEFNDAVKFCEEFKHENYKCIGKDVNI